MAIKNQDQKACVAYVSDEDVHCGEFDIMWATDEETEIHHITTDDYTDADHNEEGLEVATEEWYAYAQEIERRQKEYTNY